MSELTPANCGVKKLNGNLTGSGLVLDATTSGASASSAAGTCSDGNSCYPSPYDMTKLTNCNGSGSIDNASSLLESLRGHTIPLKSSSMVDSSPSASGEPMYATVKRTPRAPRSSDTTCHVYQYPLTLQGATLIAPDGSCFETESSCVSLSSGVGPPTTSAYIRIQEDSITDKSLAGRLFYFIPFIHLVEVNLIYSSFPPSFFLFLSRFSASSHFGGWTTNSSGYSS